MSFFQLRIDVDAEFVDRLEACLEALGAQSITFSDRGDEPILEPGPGEVPLWGQLRATALFDAARHDPDSLHQALLEATGWDTLPGFAVETLPERAWERAWLDDFRPMRFGERVWICPTTASAPADEQAAVIWLDPGLAFGTGTHPTTALCLAWLDQTPLAGRTVVDYGCGSGILAIAALKLGAAHCVAVDNDPQALRATRENARRNEVGERLSVLHADEADTLEPADVLVANILSGTLRTLAPRLMKALLPAGPFALSGILAEQGDTVAAAYQPYAEMGETLRRGDWILVQGRRHGRS
ncbi:50S ribosomal protein L11 methyltransferase [Ectothiorhodospiraceae bacterium WFHF3C12]|nr:50S ribosomal protein L11 methyltransferase [Ectothiorhodospiraceae bacterium WFHF3C12]